MLTDGAGNLYNCSSLQTICTDNASGLVLSDCWITGATEMSRYTGAGSIIIDDGDDGASAGSTTIKEGTFTSTDSYGKSTSSTLVYDSYSFEADAGKTVEMILEGDNLTYAVIFLYYETFNPSELLENSLAMGSEGAAISETLAQSGTYYSVVGYKATGENDEYDGVTREYTLTWTLE